MAVVVICYRKNIGRFSSIGCVGIFNADVNVKEIIDKHAAEYNLNSLLDYTVFRGLVE